MSTPPSPPDQMKTTIQFIDCQPAITVRRHLEDKLEKLESRYDWILEGKVCLRRNKNNTKKNKVTEISILIPGHTFYAEVAEENFRLSCDKALAAIHQQLEKHKTILLEKNKMS